MKKRLLLFLAFIMTAIIMNAQTGCNVIIINNGPECLLTEYLDNTNPSLLNEGIKDAIAVCQGSSVQYDAVSENVASYSWSVLGGTITGTANGGSSVYVTWGSTDFGSIKVTVTLTDGTKCEKEKNVYLIEKPNINSTSEPNYLIDPGSGDRIIEVCFGGKVEFTDASVNDETNVTGYYWDGTYGSASTKNYKIENIQQDGEVKHLIMSYCGCDAEEHYKIKVIEGKNLQLSCYGTVCEGSTVVYEALNSNCSQYDWIIEGGTIINGQNSPTVEVSWGSPESGYGTIGLDGTLCNDMCHSIMSVKIPIISSHAIISGQEEVCQGDIIKYGLPLWGSTSYNWTVSPSQGVTKHYGDNINEIMLEFNTPGTYTLSSTYECEFIDCGPLTSPTKTIVVKPVLKVVSKDNNICAGNIGTFNTDANVSVTWRVLNQNNQQVYTTQNTTLNYQFNTVGSYIVTAENTNYCNVASFAVRVNGKPAALAVGSIEGDHTSCPNSSILLTGTSIPSCHLEWAPSCSTATPQTGQGTDFTVQYGQSVCNVNVYQVDNITGCRSDAYVHTVSLFQLNNITLPTSLTRCPGSSIDISILPQDGVFYEWTIASEEKATITGDKTSGTVNVLVNYMASGINPNFNINLKRTYCSGLYQTTTIPVTVVSQAAAPTITNSGTCSKNNIAFTATGGSSNPANYSWVIDGSTSEGVNPAYHTFNTGGTYNVQLTYSPDDYCEPTVVNTTITVFNSPNVIITKSGTNLIASVNYDNNNTSANTYHYSWTTPDGSNPTTSSCTINGDGNYCCNVQNMTTGCSSNICYDYTAGTNCNGISITASRTCKTVTATATSTYNLNWDTDGETTISNNTHTATIEYNTAGIHTIYVNATNSSPYCYKQQVQVTIPFVPDFKLNYNCTTHKLEIVDKSQYYPATTLQTRTLNFSIVGGGNTYNTTIVAGSTTREISISLPSSQTTYTATLSYGGCTLTKTIDLYPAPTITGITHSGPNPTQLCEKVPFLFSATTTGAPDLTYNWDFGDGSSNKGNNIYHTFENTSNINKTIILTVKDNNGCTSSYMRELLIFDNNVTGGLNTIENSPNVCPGESRLILYSPNANIITYEWNPVKATINTTPNLYEYNTFYTGDYNVKVISNIGCVDQKRVNVRFLNKPYVYISAQTKYCEGETITFDCYQRENYAYQWTLTNLDNNTTVPLTNGQEPSISFIAQVAANYSVTNYSIKLVVSTTDGCSAEVTQGFSVYAKPAKPQLIFGGNPCIHTPPVILQDQNNNSVYWNIGIHSNIASYYTPGFATAYNVDHTTGCKSDDATIYIEPAPNFDALLTGCYKKCLPDKLNVYSIAPLPIQWEWIYDHSSVEDYGNSNSMLLPVGYYDGPYTLNAGYGSYGCNTESPSLTIEEPDKCGCDGITITPNGKEYCYVKGCKVYYQTSLLICNNSGSTITFDQFTAMSGVNIVSTNVVPLTLTNGQCVYIQFDFELTDPSVSLVGFSLYSSQTNCLKTFSVSIDLSGCMTDKCEVDLKELNFIDNMDGTLVFDFLLGLPNSPSVVYKVWTEPDRIHFYNLNLPNTIDGTAMFDYAELTQLIANGEEVCFYVLMCIDDQICEAKVCIKAEEILEMSGCKSMTNTNATRPNQPNEPTKIDKNAPYLVPNPADTYVKIEGIEQDNIVEVFLIDISGKKLKEIYKRNILDINDVPSGTYFVRVMNKSQKAYYLKLIKN